MQLTDAELLQIQAECFAEDIAIDFDVMRQWPRAAVYQFFESGGITMPGDTPGPAGQHGLSVFCVSDLHVEHAANTRWLHTLPDGQGGAAVAGSILLCCGDVATEPETMRRALRALRRAYDHVFFVPGNHDICTSKLRPHPRAQLTAMARPSVSGVTCKSAGDSIAKYRALLRIALEEGVKVGPERFVCASGAALWVVPIASWHHKSWDREPPLRAPPGHVLAVEPKARHMSSDEACCRWPPPLEHGTEALAAAMDQFNDWIGFKDEAGALPPLPMSFAEAVESIARERAAAAGSGTAAPTVLSMSHMLPRQELLPLKRHLVRCMQIACVIGRTWHALYTTATAA